MATRSPQEDSNRSPRKELIRRTSGTGTCYDLAQSLSTLVLAPTLALRLRVLPTFVA